MRPRWLAGSFGPYKGQQLLSSAVLSSWLRCILALMTSALRRACARAARFILGISFLSSSLSIVPCIYEDNIHILYFYNSCSMISPTTRNQRNQYLLSFMCPNRLFHFIYVSNFYSFKLNFYNQISNFFP